MSEMPLFAFPVRSVEAVVRRVPIDVPVRTSFGIMRDRPAVFLRVTDAGGVAGYGEVWCNFPNVAAEHRQRLAVEVVGPLLAQCEPPADGGVYEMLMRRLHVLAIQSGEWGPLRQVCAGIDAAIHDLAARRAGVPLYAFLEPAASPRIRAYASGIGPEDPGAVAARFREAGHTAFKVKVGFGRDTDHATLRAARGRIGTDAVLMADANQRWTLAEALDEAGAMDDAGLAWLEEPLAADRPQAEWRQLAGALQTRLAAGENVDTLAAYDDALAGGAIRYVQPDVAKWGGVSGCIAVARRARAHGLTYCPHFLGGGIGLLASAHLLAAAGGDGMLEVDTNPNPLRDDVAGGHLAVADGMITLAGEPGIGIVPDHLFD